MKTLEELSEDARALLVCMYELSAGKAFVPVSSGELAGLIGWDVERVNRAARELRDSGFVAGGTEGKPHGSA
jgi:predicted transcriptional regulator